jgi:pilus assembly protein CpaB
MKNRAIIPLVLGVVVGLIAIKFSVDTIQRAKGARAPTLQGPAVVAHQDIPASVRITPDMLVVKTTPHTPLLPADAYTSVDELVGRVSRKFIPQGAPVAPSMIAPEGTTPGIEERIPEGYRAVSVKVDEATSVAYLLRPGCFVDVIVVMDVKQTGRAKETVSRVILQRVKVGAVGQTLGEDTGDEGANRVKSVTLIVKEDDVPKLHLAQTKGRLTLAMRAENDVLLADASEAHEGELWGEKTEPRAGPSGASPLVGSVPSLSSTPIADARTRTNEPVTVTVINGTRSEGADVSRITFEDIFSMSVVNVERGLTAGDRGGAFVPTSTEDDQNLGPPRPRVLTDRERRLRRIGAGSRGGYSDLDAENRSSEEAGE